MYMIDTSYNIAGMSAWVWGAEVFEVEPTIIARSSSTTGNPNHHILKPYIEIIGGPGDLESVLHGTWVS